MKTLKKILIAALIIATPLAAIHVFFLDGLDGLFCAMLDSDDTQYAPRYSAGAFRKVQGGMKTSEVEALIGPPLEIWALGGDFIVYSNATQIRNAAGKTFGWQYSRSPNNASYRRRVVEVQDGVVVAKVAEFYLD